MIRIYDEGCTCIVQGDLKNLQFWYFWFWKVWYSWFPLVHKSFYTIFGTSFLTSTNFVQFYPKFVLASCDCAFTCLYECTLLSHTNTLTLIQIFLWRVEKYFSNVDKNVWNSSDHRSYDTLQLFNFLGFNEQTKKICKKE